MQIAIYDRRAAVLDHPFYKNDIGKYGERSRRRMFEIDANGCFIWQGACNSKGYPTRDKGKLVHRLAWIAFFGSITVGHEIHHACDGHPNKKCINIDHLDSLSTADHRSLEGRPLKLDAEKVREILRLVMQGVRRRVIAERFNITRHYVTEIKNAKTWKAVVHAFRREQCATPPLTLVGQEKAVSNDLAFKRLSTHLEAA